MTPRRRFSGQRAGRRRASIGSVLIAALLFGGVLSILAPGRLDEGRLAPACPPGLGRGVWDPGFFFGDDAPARNAAQKLLDNPNFGASPEAAVTWRPGL